MKKIIILIFLFLFLLSCLVNADTLIKSNWKLEDPKKDKTPISAVEFETLEVKKKQLADEEKIEEAKMQAQIAVIKEKRKELLKCMSEKGVLLFTSEKPNCEACKQQLKYFGDDVEELKRLKIYINCDSSAFTCPLRNIKYYPTWYLGNTLGIKREGLKDLEKLAKMIDCPW